MKIILLHNSTHSQMMGMIIVTGNGRIIAIDGGTKGDKDEFKRIVCENGSKIDLWLLTHPHADHHGVFVDMSNSLDTDIKIDKVCYCPAADDYITTDPDFHAVDVNIIKETMAQTRYPVQIVKKGDIFNIDNVKVEVLRVVNPNLNPCSVNDLSVVYSITEMVDGICKFKLMILGDMSVPGGKELLELYKDNPDALRADGVQMAHHGQCGVSREVYVAIDAKYAFWPTPDWLWTNTINKDEPGQGPWQTLIVRKWMEDLNTTSITAMEKHVVFDTDIMTVTNL